MHYRHKDTTRENGQHPCTKSETSQKNQPPHESAATSKFNQSKNNRYQQTWHTIEFSNNRNKRLLAGRALPRFIRLVFPRRYIYSLFHSLFPCQIPRRGLQATQKNPTKQSHNKF